LEACTEGGVFLFSVIMTLKIETGDKPSLGKVPFVSIPIVFGKKTLMVLKFFKCFSRIFKVDQKERWVVRIR
jgi:hypothetical protein